MRKVVIAACIRRGGETFSAEPIACSLGGGCLGSLADAQINSNLEIKKNKKQTKTKYQTL